MFPRGLPKTNTFKASDDCVLWYGRFKRVVPGVPKVTEYGGERLGRWPGLVETYLMLALTKPEDKLIAFTEIANLMQQRPEMSGDVYLAERRKENGEPATRLGTYVAPSWSWASVQGHVSLHYGPIILEPETYASGEDVMRSVSRGYIKLRDFPRRAGVRKREAQAWPSGSVLTMVLSGESFECDAWMDKTDMSEGTRCTEGVILEQLDLDRDIIKRVGRFTVQGYAAALVFYGFGWEFWKRPGSSARAVMMEKAAVLSERVVTLL
ncbi:hypothetical protein N657DRAFT_630691 [Parathielavia appendiculata]|uniref:Uncharacterized protein n=1 Tax=Parathielavia appendiculata TaxID=2587402 RepID=A0AAN6Z6S6_9PEZI|nr:hypothetical protein N657DRAFT_630691 [Parathielavia appendiculata]